jgi:hypothetical protein
MVDDIEENRFGSLHNGFPTEISGGLNRIDFAFSH